MKTVCDQSSGPTLYSQLMRAMLIIYLFAVFGLFGGYWRSTSVFVERQLASHAQDAASSLALALSVALKDGDIKLAETTVMPIFDRGYYRSIVVKNTEGNIILERHLNAEYLSTVPEWFRSFAELHPLAQVAVVSAGWSQVGYVEVVSEPRFGYEQLWRSSLQVLLWMLFIAVVSMLFARFWLKSILVPLSRLEQAAQDVAKRHFYKVELQPKVIEIKRLVSGFNGLVDAIQMLLGKEEARAERFRKETLTDQMTGMLNRRGLADFIDDSTHGNDWLGIIECHDLDMVNEKYGRNTGNNLITMLAQTLRGCFADGVTARLSASGFAIILHEPESEKELLEGCLDFFKKAGFSCSSIIEPLHIKAGWAPRHQRNFRDWLAAADQVLKKACEDSGTGCLLENYDADLSETSGFEPKGWGQMVRMALEQKRIRLYSQPTIFMENDGNRQVLHREIFTVLLDEQGNEHLASEWIEVAGKQGLLAELDKAVLEIISAANHVLEGVVVVNLSADSWGRYDFIEGLPELSVRLKKWEKVIFEIREEDVVRLQQTSELFVTEARKSGFGVAIERFGLSAGGIASLRRLLPEYVKLDVSLVKKLDTDADIFHLESLVTIAKTLDISVFALTFGQKDLIEELQQLGISGIQGDAVSGREPFLELKL